MVLALKMSKQEDRVLVLCVGAMLFIKRRRYSARKATGPNKTHYQGLLEKGGTDENVLRPMEDVGRRSL